MSGFAPSGVRSALPSTFTPIIFCGPGSNLYPLCDPSSSTSTEVAASIAESLPKSLLPVANRPLISFPLQHLVSAGIKHAIVLAPANQHQVIETALKTVRLQVPNLNAAASLNNASSTTTPYVPSITSPSQESNIVVTDGLLPTAGAASTDTKDTAIRVQLLPLGPYDTLGSTLVEESGDSAEEQDDEDADDNDEADAFRRIARPGTAELLRWLDTIGKLESDPLVLPVDFIAPSIPLSTFLLSYYSSMTPSSPTVTSLLYERGAGESLGRDREKEGPPRVVAAYSHSDSQPSGRTPLLSTHDLLFLSEPPTAATSSSSSLDVRLSLLRSHPRARISTNLIDSHVYIFRRHQVIPLLKARKDLTSLREHVVPLIAKTSWQNGLLDKSGWRESIRKDRERRSRARLGSAGDEDETLDQGSGEDSLMRLAFERSSLHSTSATREEESIRAVTVVARLQSTLPTLVPSLDGNSKEAGGSGSNSSSYDKAHSQQQTPSEGTVEERFFARANTLPTYLECNRFLLRALAASGASGSPLYFPLPVLVNGSSGSGSAGAGANASTTAVPLNSSDYPPVETHEVSGSSQLSPDTLLPLSPTPLSISDRVSLKRSLVASHVRISRSCRISGSVIMEGSVIGDGAKLENCIIGPGARVGERCTLRDVDLGPGAKVKKGFEGRGEKIGREEDESGSEDSGAESEEG